MKQFISLVFESLDGLKLYRRKDGAFLQKINRSF